MNDEIDTTSQTVEGGTAGQEAANADTAGEGSEAGGAPARSRSRRGRRGGRGRSRSRASGAGSTQAEGESPSGAEERAEGTSDTQSADAQTAQTAQRARGTGSGSARRSNSSTSSGRSTGSSTSRNRSGIESAAGSAAADGGGSSSGTSIADPASTDAGAAAEGTGSANGQAPSTQRRRRRRGGRGRAGSSASAAEASTVEADGGEKDTPAARTPAKRSTSARSRSAGAAVAGDSTRDADAATEGRDESADGGVPAARSRSRRRRRKPASPPSRENGEAGLDDPPAAVAADEKKNTAAAKKRAPAAKKEKEDAAAGAGPTRLRRGRAAPTRTRARTRRRQEPLIFPPRVTDKLMVITEHGDRDQIAVLEDRDLVQHYVTRAGAKSMVGNIYLGRVQNVLPGMEAAFVDVGRGRNAVLYAGEVNYSAEELDGDTPPRIQDVLKSGQSVLVQVTKDPMGGKGARLTAQISVPGRFLVLMPNSSVFGISRRIPDEERKRLKALSKKIRPDGFGLIIRTAAEGASEEAMTADLERVVQVWKDTEKRSKKAKAPALLYEEPELTVRVVRDLFTDEEYRELVTDSQRIYDKVTSYLNEVAPDLAEKVRLHQGKLSAFEEHHVVEQIHKALDRKVWLPSGGYLIIERTEAMTVIDVNTGKSIGKTNLEETVVGTNLEASREVARQLRLRDIGGIIIVDFIDMLLERNKEKVVDTLREAMAQDKTRSQVFEIGPLGLLEITRKRVSGGLVESFSETCPTCEGRGILVNYEA
jgi:ribonuclease E